MLNKKGLVLHVFDQILVTGHELFLKTNELSDSDGGGGFEPTNTYIVNKHTSIKSKWTEQSTTQLWSKVISEKRALAKNLEVIEDIRISFKAVKKHLLVWNVLGLFRNTILLRYYPEILLLALSKFKRIF